METQEQAIGQTSKSQNEAPRLPAEKSPFVLECEQILASCWLKIKQTLESSPLDVELWQKLEQVVFNFIRPEANKIIFNDYSNASSLKIMELQQMLSDTFREFRNNMIYKNTSYRIHGNEEDVMQEVMEALIEAGAKIEEARIKIPKG